MAPKEETTRYVYSGVKANADKVSVSDVLDSMQGYL
jgi:hypothetical protein